MIDVLTHDLIIFSIMLSTHNIQSDLLCGGLCVCEENEQPCLEIYIFERMQQ